MHRPGRVEDDAVMKAHLMPDSGGYFEPTTEWDKERSHDRFWSWRNRLFHQCGSPMVGQVITYFLAPIGFAFNEVVLEKALIDFET